MTLEPILNAPFEILIHLVFAAVAISVGPFALFRTKRDRVHKILGYVWVFGMGGLAITGLFIHSEFALVGRFGPIHALSIFTLWGLFEAVSYARKGNVERHQSIMKSIWYGAICVTGLLTLLPGRTLNRVLFGEPSQGGFILIALGLTGLLWLYLNRHRRKMRRLA